MPTINSRFYIKSSESPIFVKSYEALRTILQRVYGEKITIIGTLDENDINRELGRTTLDTSSYPYIMVTPTNMTTNDESYNDFALKKYGTEPKQHTDGYWYTFHLKPVRVTVTVSFFSQSFSDCLKFMSNWSFNSREGTFKLNTKSGISFDIHVDIQGDLNFPTRDLTEGSPLKVTGTLILDTYVGEIYKSPTLKGLRKDIRLVLAPDFDDLEPSISIDPVEEQLVKITRYNVVNACDVPEPEPEPGPEPVITEFDYIVLRYMWTSGKDLDTYTSFTNLTNLPNINNQIVGWSRLTSVPEGSSVPRCILYWAGDNQGRGQESILLNYSNLKAGDNYNLLPDILQMQMQATWYSSVGTAPVYIRIEAYKGGTMSFNTGAHAFVNTGGQIVKIKDVDGIEKDFVDVEVLNLSSNLHQYNDVASVTINKKTGAARIYATPAQ